MIRLVALFAVTLLTGCSAASDPSASDGGAQATPGPAALLPLVIQSASGAHRFDVEVASTPLAQQKGLMFRKALDADGGMVFPMTPPRIASFWMENTLIPLDMLFVRTDGTIAFIAANQAPYSRTPVSAGIPVAAVLELAGGRAAELGIRQGDTVRWGRCAAPGQKIATDRDFCPATAR